MPFDPAVAAQQAFAKARQLSERGGELGEELAAAVEAEERFSSSAGEDASAAYRELVAIGARHPEASYFLEFLVYATWCHLMDETVPEHFKRGVTLCQQLLRHLDAGGEAERVKRLRSIEQSFRAGLGETSDDVMGYEADTLQGGD
jgi:hypothetical protein